MLDFDPIWKKETTLGQLAAGLTTDDLRRLTNEMVDHMLSLIAECNDADVVFVPVEPAARDGAGGQAEQGWTLAHVIAHATASAEESSYSAAGMARGVPPEGRSRYEVPWETITTIAQCRQRLDESRRMRLASLGMWPDQPHLDVTLELPFLEGPLNPVARYVLGLMHDSMHIGQIAEIVRQAHDQQP